MDEEDSCDKLPYYLASGHGLCGQLKIDAANKRTKYQRTQLNSGTYTTGFSTFVEICSVSIKMQWMQ